MEEAPSSRKHWLLYGITGVAALAATASAMVLYFRRPADDQEDQEEELSAEESSGEKEKPKQRSKRDKRKNKKNKARSKQPTATATPPASTTAPPAPGVANPPGAAGTGSSDAADTIRTKSRSSVSVTETPTKGTAKPQLERQRMFSELRLSEMDKEAEATGEPEEVSAMVSFRFREMVLNIDLAVKIATELNIDLDTIPALRQACSDLPPEQGMPSELELHEALGLLRKDPNPNPAHIMLVYAMLSEAVPDPVQGASFLTEAIQFWVKTELAVKFPLIEAWVLYKLAPAEENTQDAILMLNRAKDIFTKVLGPNTIQASALEHSMVTMLVRENQDDLAFTKLAQILAQRAKHIPAGSMAVAAFISFINPVAMNLLELCIKTHKSQLLMESVQKVVTLAISVLGPEAIEAIGPNGLGQELLQQRFTCPAYVHLVEYIVMLANAQKIKIDADTKWTLFVDTVSAHLVSREFDRALENASVAKKMVEDTPNDEGKSQRVQHAFVNEAIAIIQSGRVERFKEAKRPLKHFIQRSAVSPNVDGMMLALALVHLLAVYERLDNKVKTRQLRDRITPDLLQIYEQLGIRRAWIMMIYGQEGLEMEEAEDLAEEAMLAQALRASSGSVPPPDEPRALSRSGSTASASAASATNPAPLRPSSASPKPPSVLKSSTPYEMLDDQLVDHPASEEDVPDLEPEVYSDNDEHAPLDDDEVRIDDVEDEQDRPTPKTTPLKSKSTTTPSAEEPD